MKERKLPYTCARCGYTTEHKACMRAHLYNLKKGTCYAKFNIVLTDYIKEQIINYRIYHQEEDNQQAHHNTINNNYNFVNYNTLVTNLDLKDKIDKLLHFEAKKLVPLDESIEKKYSKKCELLEYSNEIKSTLTLSEDDML